MNLPHVHIVLNHIPTIGFSVGLALFFIALFSKSLDLKRASLSIMLLIAVVATPVYVSGVAAAETICPKECLPGVAKTSMVEHEDAALLAYAVMQVAGAMAFLGLWQMRRTRLGGKITAAILLFSVVTFGLMARAATIGGEIRHSEILSEEAAAAATAGTQSASAPMLGVRAIAIHDFVQRYSWIWPACEALHFVGLSLLFTVMLIVDLRLLGVAKSIPYSALHKMLPWGLVGFAVNLVTGMMFFISAPEQYTNNIVFLWKLICIVLAGVNILYFLFFDEAWGVGSGDDAPIGSKIAAVSAIFLWVGVLFCGHMLPFLGTSF